MSSRTVLNYGLLSIVLATQASCTIRSNWPEHQVRIELEPTLHDQAVVDALASQELWIVVDAVELIPCDAQLSNVPVPLSKIFENISFISNAYAHGPTTPIRQGVPNIIGLHQLQTMELATFEPPPDSYCALKVDVGPADDDAYNLSAKNSFVEDHSIYYRDDNDHTMALATLRTDHTFTLDESTWTFGVEQDQHHTITIKLDLDQLLADKLPENIDDSGRTLLTRMSGAWTMDSTQEVH